MGRLHRHRRVSRCPTRTAAGRKVGVVPSDASAAPRRVLHDDKDVSNLGWSDDNWLQYTAGGQRWKLDPSTLGAPSQVAEGPASDGRGAGGRGGRGGGGRGGQTALPSPDGKWEAATVNKPQPAEAPRATSEFEKRHQERFKGVIFDWKDFQRDGAEFPAPNPVAQPAQQVVVRSRPASAKSDPPKVLVDMDLRPANLAWHPDGQTIAFTADPDWRNELKYTSPDLWTVTVDGKVTRLTNDALRLRRRGLLARRQVPVLFAIVRHRHDHREAAQSRRAAGPLHQAGRAAASRST